MNNIKFSQPFDKLKPPRFKEGSYFTTFRGYSPRKDKYYQNVKNQYFYVLLEGKAIGKTMLTSIKYRWSDDLTLEEIKNDTYQHWTEADWKNFLQSIYDNTRVFGFWLNFKITRAGPTNKTLESYVG